ncbi:MAG: hypothetical protein N2508_12460 [Anaerolineae bacterium]|nr:hypothetical protein [Anaerolineae bacterium]
MKKLAWPVLPLGIVTIALAIFAAPTPWEGPVIIPISAGHALSLLDSFATVVLLVGMAWLYGGLWQRRERLYHVMRRSPGASSVAIFVAGLGLGLLIASAFSSFFWWWAVGAVIFGAVLIMALSAATV